MRVAPGTTRYGRFVVLASTGALTDADATPTVSVYRNGASIAPSVTVANVSTGHYSYSYSVSSAYAANDQLSEVIAYAVSSVSTAQTREYVLDAVVGSMATGARTVTLTVNDGSTALENAVVRLTEGTTAVRGTTSVAGTVTFNLADGSYTVAITKAGYSYAGTTLVVDGDETATYSMSAVTITPSADPTTSNAYLYTYNGKGDIAGSKTVYFRLIVGPGTTAKSHDVDQFQATSNASTGLLQVALMRGARYQARRGSGRWIEFAVADATTYALPELLGYE